MTYARGVLIALLLLAAPAVDVQLHVKKPLKLTRRGELRGVLEMRITNGGAEPITLQHRDVHAFRFVPAGGDAGTRIIFHSCDCGFELGLDRPPPSRTFTLKPGEHRLVTFDDFTCGGGAYRAPPPGRYQLSWSVGEPASTPPAPPLDLERCDLLVHNRAPEAFESPPVSVDLRK